MVVISHCRAKKGKAVHLLLLYLLFKFQLNKICMTKILLAEDDPNFGSVLRDFLKLHHYEVTWVQDGAKGFSLVKNNQYDLCIFDVMMPEMRSEERRVG